MFLIASLLVVGGVAFAIDRAAGFLLMVIAGTLILWYPVAGILWVNNHAGISSFIIRSWQSLSGVRTPGEVYQECGGSSPIPSDTLWGVAVVVALWALSVFLVFFDILLGFGAIIGIPVGVVATGIGAVTSLLTRQKDALAFGLTILSFGLGLMVAMGLSMRIVHAATGAMC
jgi:hypothetical protein